MSESVDLAGWLRLAAAPTFAAMALATAWQGEGEGALCHAAGASPIGGMTVMYLLMSVFHAPPFVAQVARRWAWRLGRSHT